MKRLNYSYLALIIILVACSSSPPEKEEVRYHPESPRITTTQPLETGITARLLANEFRSENVAEIDFKTGSPQLTEKGQKELEEHFDEAVGENYIKEVLLVTWADKEFPSQGRRKLSQRQIRLAEKRNKELHQALLDLDEDIVVRAVNMAYRTKFLEKLLATKSARIKDSLKDFGIATTSPQQVAPKWSSHSIVIFVPDV